MDVIRQSYKYFKKILPIIVFLCFLMIVHIVMALIIPQMSSLIIDKILYPALGQGEPQTGGLFDFILAGFAEDAYLDKLLVAVAIMGACCLLLYANHYVKWNVTHYTHRRVGDEMRADAFKKFLSCSPKVLHRYTSGELMTILNTDVDNVMDIWSHRFHMMFSEILMIAGTVTIMLITNVYMAIIPLLLCVVSFFVSRAYRKKLRVHYDKIREGNVDLSSCVQENINGVRIIRSYATEGDEMAKFEKKNLRFKDNYVSLAKLSSRYNVYFRLIGVSMTVAAMAVGVVLAVRGDITVGQFTTFTTYVNMLNNNVINIAAHLGLFQNSLVAGRRLFGFINGDDGIDHSKEALDMPAKPNYKFNGVTMSFNGVNALDNIELDLPYGKKVGIMGKTGCGKSVMMRLINRFYDCSGGEITVDGRNITEYKLEEVRRATSPVSQDVFLFSETVGNNIAFYDEGRDLEKIEKFAALARVDKFIPRLSDGLDTVVGERGLGLSGGQKQRVSIARALYKDAPVLLLDDCTSALDYQTEKEIIENIEKNFGEKTLLIASNRATSVSFCDEILYMEDGVIIERGTHAELMTLGGKYAAIYTSQTSGSVEEVA